MYNRYILKAGAHWCVVDKRKAGTQSCVGIYNGTVSGVSSVFYL